MWARIEEEIVKEITDIDPEGRFHPSLIWAPCDETVRQGMKYEEGVFSEAEPIITSPSKLEMEVSRLTAYSDPINGSDRYFAEVMSLQAQGFTSTSQEVKDLKAKGLARKLEIQALYPYPVE